MESVLYEKILERLKRIGKTILTTHQNPDPDGIGSELAMYWLLGRLQIPAIILNNDPVPAKYNFLDPNRIMYHIENEPTELLADSVGVVLLDSNDPKRCVRVQKYIRPDFSNLTIIDHHDTNDEYSNGKTYQFMEPGRSSTSEIIFRLIRHSGELPNISQEVARALYAGIIADTGGFRFNKTKPATHKAAAELLRYGVNPDEVYRALYANSPVGRLFIKRDLYGSLQIREGVAWVYMRKEDLERLDLTWEDMDGIINELLEPAAIHIGILFTEREPGKTRVSVRTKGVVDALSTVQKYGGGGHRNACGAVIPLGLESAMREFVPLAVACLPS